VALAPDHTPDDEMLRADEAHNDLVSSQRAFRRTHVPDNMIGPPIFLAGPGSDFVTGQSLLVNGRPPLVPAPFSALAVTVSSDGRKRPLTQGAFSSGA
jgi:hypothetical protein